MEEIDAERPDVDAGPAANPAWTQMTDHIKGAIRTLLTNSLDPVLQRLDALEAGPARPPPPHLPMHPPLQPSTLAPTPSSAPWPLPLKATFPPDYDGDREKGRVPHLHGTLS